MSSFTLLTIDQIDSKEHKLSIFDVVDPYRPMSDFARLTGVSTVGFKNSPYGLMMTSSRPDFNIYNLSKECISFLSYGIYETLIYDHQHLAGILPVIPAEITKTLTPKNKRVEKFENGKTIAVCEFGTYPQKVILDKDFIKEFQESAQKTEDFFTINIGKTSHYYMGNKSTFKESHLPVYTWQDRKFVVLPQCIVEVLPVEFMMDSTGVWVAKNILIGNIPYWDQTHKGSRFEQTCVAEFLNTLFNQLSRDYFKEKTALKLNHIAKSNGLTVLSKEQMTGAEQLDVFKEIHWQAPITTFASLQRAWDHTRNKNVDLLCSIEQGSRFSACSTAHKAPCLQESDGPLAIPFVIPPEVTKHLEVKKYPVYMNWNPQPVEICSFGSYPQKVIYDDKFMTGFHKEAKATGAFFTVCINDEGAISLQDTVTTRKVPVYSYQNREFIVYDEKHLVEVLPVTFIIDKSGYWVSTESLLGNIPYWDKAHPKSLDKKTCFEQTATYDFLKTVWNELITAYQKERSQLKNMANQPVCKPVGTQKKVPFVVRKNINTLEYN